MRLALDLSASARTLSHPNPSVGCVLLAPDGQPIGQGHTQAPGGPHAEIMALRDAAARGHSVAGATAYVTLEPCSHHGRTPPCVDALLAAGVRRVVYAVGDPDPRVNGRGASLLREAGVQVESGLLEADSETLNEGFLTRVRRKRPFIRLKTGASLDGRTALANGESRWITGEPAREDVQHWRAQSAAVLTSAATVLADDPRLDVRIDTPRQPLRVVLDRRRVVRRGARILKSPGRVLLFSASRAKASRDAAPEKLGTATIERVKLRNSHLDLARVFARLAELEINEVLVEAGPRLSGALLTAGLVDEWIVYVAPKLLGRDARPLAVMPRLRRLRDAPQFELRDTLAVGNDVRLRLRPRRKT